MYQRWKFCYRAIGTKSGLYLYVVIFEIRTLWYQRLMLIKTSRKQLEISHGTEFM